MTKEERKEYDRIYYQKNKEKVISRSKKYYQNNKEKKREYYQNVKQNLLEKRRQNLLEKRRQNLLEKRRQNLLEKRKQEFVPLEGEKWRNVKGYEGIYKISNKARWFNCLTYRVSYGSKNAKGYTQVELRKDGKRIQRYLHTLVAEAFIPNPENKPFVDHIVPLKNGGTNEASNLRWVTQKENCNNELSIKNYKIANAHKGGGKPRKPILQFDLQGNFIRKWNSATEAGNSLGLNNSRISACCRNYKNQNTAYGYIWKFENA